MELMNSRYSGINNIRKQKYFTEPSDKTEKILSSFNPSIEPIPFAKDDSVVGVIEVGPTGSNSTVSGDSKHSFSKTDTYNPKYLELLEKNTDRYALAFKNLDIYSDSNIDLALEEMSKNRIKNLSKLGKNLLGKVEECTNVISPLYNTEGKVCIKYSTPIYKESDKVKLARKLEPKLVRPNNLAMAKDEIVINNFHTTVDNLITKEEYEIAEGTKIMEWIENNLVYYGGYNSQFFNQMMFSDLITLQYKGHVFISRAGITEPNLVTPAIVKLDHLSSYYNRPINPTQLLIQIQSPTNIGDKTIEKISAEAEKILSLEYFICLQPEPRFMLFILKRLIIAWYSDFDLIQSITKIRILINQYRAKRDQQENLALGVMPSILIYLRYGAINFNRALSKINFYFTNYIHTGWVNNEPDYFTKYNQLIYYSNGSPDIKRFFEHLPISSKMDIYKPYTINPTSMFKYADDIVSPNVQPYDKLYKLQFRSKFDLDNELKNKGSVTSVEDIDKILQKKQIISNNIGTLNFKHT